MSISARSSRTRADCTLNSDAASVRRLRGSISSMRAASRVRASAAKCLTLTSGMPSSAFSLIRYCASQTCRSSQIFEMREGGTAWLLLEGVPGSEAGLGFGNEEASMRACSSA